MLYVIRVQSGGHLVAIAIREPVLQAAQSRIQADETTPTVRGTVLQNAEAALTSARTDSRVALVQMATSSQAGNATEVIDTG